jgi:chorismate mutase
MAGEYHTTDQPQYVRAVRGAITVAADERALLCEGVQVLLVEMMLRNEISSEDIVSASFTLTADLRSEFPARAARYLDGWDEVPMVCSVEADVPGSVPRCIRVLMHIYTPRTRRDIRHVYLRDAAQLRPEYAAPAWA